MIQIGDIPFLCTVIFLFETHAVFMYDFQPQVCTNFHLVELTADVIAVNHGRSPLSGYKKGAPLLGERPYFVVF